jgi:hypothetical protein
MMKKYYSNNNTEELVRKCFSSCFHDHGNCHCCIHPKYIARAARKFVKKENKIKADERHAKFLRWCGKHGTKGELPEDFGEVE